jgi:hypothetical protein
MGGSRLTGLEALEALLQHKPVQRCQEGHDVVFWFSPALELWRLSNRLDSGLWVNVVDSVAWINCRDRRSYSESCASLRTWWLCWNDTYEWTLWTGEMP